MMEKEELVQIVGEGNVFDEPKLSEEYSRDAGIFETLRASYVIKPQNADQVQRIVKGANESLTPLVPVSSGPPHLHGGTVPGTDGAIIVDLNGMKKIVRIDSRNRVAMVEPGVTFRELIPELNAEGLRLNLPFLPRSTKSVVGSLLEREPVIMPRYQWDMADPLACTEVIYGTGDIFRTGAAAGPGSIEEQWEAEGAQKEAAGPTSADFYRLIQGAQGTMGIVTWASTRCERVPEIEEAFLVGSSNLENLFELIHWLIRLRLADVCLVLNGTNLATILFETGSEDCESISTHLPPWMLFFSVAGYRYFPNEKVAYQTKDMMKIAGKAGLKPEKELNGIHADNLLQVIRNPSSESYWKLNSKGACYDVFFLATCDRITELVQVMADIADQSGYSSEHMGVYLQPAVMGTSYHCEFNLFYDMENTKQREAVRTLSTEAGKALMERGAFFSRPYGLWSDIAYQKHNGTAAVLREVKKVFDPNCILNPGKLCF